MFAGWGRVLGNTSRVRYSESRAARINQRRRRRSVWFELRISGQEHVSRECATGNRIIVLHGKETHEGPRTGNRLTYTDTVIDGVFLGMDR